MNNFLSPIMNIPLYQEHVSPYIVKMLLTIGLKEAITTCWWRCEGCTCRLVTDSFDPDKFYSSARPIIDEAHGDISYMPAFTIRDMEKILPDFTISRENIIYTIKIDNNYKVESVGDSRLPDAFALMVYDCFRARVLDAKSACKSITMNNNNLSK